MYSSAFGDRRSNNSAASYRIAEGEAEPGRKTSCDDSAEMEKLSDGERREEDIRRTRNDLEKLASLIADDSSAVRLADEEDWIRVEVSEERTWGSNDPQLRRWITHLSVSPKGPTITTVLSQAATTVLSPHHTTC